MSLAVPTIVTLPANPARNIPVRYKAVIRKAGWKNVARTSDWLQDARRWATEAEAAMIAARSSTAANSAVHRSPSASSAISPRETAQEGRQAGDHPHPPLASRPAGAPSLERGPDNLHCQNLVDKLS